MAISPSDIRRAAEQLGVEPCLVSAVVDVESRGRGFLPDGRVTILFEGHIFWRELNKRGIDPAPFAASHPNIVYPRWDRTQYKGGAREHDRLNAAIAINADAALCSASYGLFQIMGFNHRACGFDTVRAFVDAQKESEVRHLEAFCAFMRHERLVPLLQNKDWADFARRYNGPGFAQNQYDTKLRQAYEKCVRQDVFAFDEPELPMQEPYCPDDSNEEPTKAALQGAAMLAGHKSIFKSKTFWGAGIAMISGLANLLGFTVTEDDQRVALAIATDAGVVLGSLLAFYGRVKASQKVTCTGKSD